MMVVELHTKNLSLQINIERIQLMINFTIESLDHFINNNSVKYLFCVMNIFVWKLIQV
jgi:hypothetical protein